MSFLNTVNVGCLGVCVKLREEFTWYKEVWLIVALNWKNKKRDRGGGWSKVGLSSGLKYLINLINHMLCD